MSIGSTMTETIACAAEAVRAAEPVAAAYPLRPVFHFRQRDNTPEGLRRMPEGCAADAGCRAENERRKFQVPCAPVGCR